MSFISKNPATEEIHATFSDITSSELESAVSAAHTAFESWRCTSFTERAALFRTLAELLKNKRADLGRLMALEMGKPIAAGRAEAEKCAWVCEYYADNAESILAPEIIATDASKSFVRFDPLGIVLAVMPWNFPFWQVFRFAAPALMAGNVGILKHASNVPQCGMAIGQLFHEAGFPDGVFTNILLPSSAVAALIEDPRIAAVTLTGSEHAGRSVGATAGKALKPSVLELGGSDPFIVLSDADLDEAARAGARARLQNCGQSCIAAKRFILDESIADAFLERFMDEFRSLAVGDPLDEKTDIGPLATEHIRSDLERQVAAALKEGATLRLGGKKLDRLGFFFEPTILDRVLLDNPVAVEETFGPIAACMRVANADEAIKVANATRFGLGASVWTKDHSLANRYASEISAGCVFINSMVKSDPRLPFGGIKQSGYGRELSTVGIKEFVNVKTVWIK